MPSFFLRPPCLLAQGGLFLFLYRLVPVFVWNNYGAKKKAESEVYGRKFKQKKAKAFKKKDSL